jgi:hypothetical protein
MILNASLLGAGWLLDRHEKTACTSGSVRRFAAVFWGLVTVSRDAISMEWTDMIECCAEDLS